MPNAEVMRGVITVNTDAPLRRQTVVLRLPAETRLPKARSALMQALADATGLEDVPPPQVVLTDVEGGDVVIECRFWTSSQRSRAAGTRDEVIESIITALGGSGIDLPVDEIRLDLPGAHNG